MELFFQLNISCCLLQIVFVVFPFFHPQNSLKNKKSRTPFDVCFLFFIATFFVGFSVGFFRKVLRVSSNPFSHFSSGGPRPFAFASPVCGFGSMMSSSLVGILSHP